MEQLSGHNEFGRGVCLICLTESGCRPAGEGKSYFKVMSGLGGENVPPVGRRGRLFHVSNNISVVGWKLMLIVVAFMSRRSIVCDLMRSWK